MDRWATAWATLALFGCTGANATSDAAAGIEPFAPGIVSTRSVEDAGTFSSDGDTFVFARRSGQWGSPGGPAVLYETRLVGGRWTEPERLPFSGNHDDTDPFLSPDGGDLFFASRRPVDGEPREQHDIWVVERFGSGWGVPRHLDSPINSAGREYSPVVTADGTLYFASTREGGFGQGDVYRARRDGGGYADPENLGSVINSARGEWNAFVTPDEDLLIFEASGRPSNESPSGDLYVTYTRSGGWTPPVALTPINTTESELNPRLSPDGRRLYFGRSVTEPDGHRHANIVWVDAASVLPHLADPGAPRVAAVARSAHELWILEAESWRPLHRVGVGRGAHEVALSPDGRFAYTADYGVYPEPHEEPIEPGAVAWIEETSGTITEVDLATAEVRRTISVPDCRLNHGILVSDDGSRLWTTCEEEGTVLEIDRSTGTLVRSWETAQGSHQLASAAGAVIVANVESGSVSIIRPGREHVVTLPTDRGAEGLAVAPDARTVWVANAQASTISVVDLTEDRVLETFPSGGRFPVKLAFTPDGSTVWVVNTLSRSLAVFDAATRGLLHTHELETPPLGLLVAPTGDAVIVSFPRRNEVLVLDPLHGEVLATVRGVMEADGLAWIPGAG